MFDAYKDYIVELIIVFGLQLLDFAEIVEVANFGGDIASIMNNVIDNMYML